MKLVMEGWRDWLNRDKEEEEPKPPPEPSIKYGNVYVDRRFSAGIDKHGNRRGGRLYTFKTTATFSPGNKHINLWGVLADNTGYLLSGMRKGQEKSYPRLVPGSGGIIVDLEKDIKIPNVDDQNALDGDTAMFLHRGSIAISTKVPTPAPRKGENPYDPDQEFQHWFLRGSLSLESYDDFKAAYEQAKDIIVNGAGRLSMAAPTPGEGELSLSNDNDNDNGALSVVKESKLIMEGWKRFLNEEEGGFLWHGSRFKFDGPVKPSQAHDVGGHPEQNLNAIYATENKKMATYIGLVEPDADGNFDIFSDFEKDQLVIVKGNIRKGKEAHLYKLPKDAFRNTGVPSDEPEWVSKEPVEPIEREDINVDDYLHLVRTATEEDMEFWNKHNTEG